MTIRIVLADDHPVMRGGIRALIEKAPDLAVVGEAGSGIEALRVVDDLAPDVLVLDMAMPGLSGVEVARRLTDVGAPVRILGLSACDDERYIVALLECGAAGYLPKDEAPEHIVEAVRGVACGEEGWFSRRVMTVIARQRKVGPAAPAETVDELSARERQVLHLIAGGATNEEIAATLRLAPKTVKNYITNIYDKLDVQTRTQAAAWAWRQGLMDDMNERDG